MIRMYVRLFIAVTSVLRCADMYGHDVHVRAVHHAKIPLAICVATAAQQEVHDIASIIKDDCSFSGQFAASVLAVTTDTVQKTLGDLSTQGYCLAVYLDDAE